MARAALYHFASLHPDIDVRVSSSLGNANFITDGVDAAIRNLAIGSAPDADLVVEELVEMCVVPVCSPKLIAAHGPFTKPDVLRRVPLIHDDARSRTGLAFRPGATGFPAAGVKGVGMTRGLRFGNSDHALDATVRAPACCWLTMCSPTMSCAPGNWSCRFRSPCTRAGPSISCAPKARASRPNVQAFRDWLRAEITALDWSKWRGGRARARTRR